jgi:hypothetical protein
LMENFLSLQHQAKFWCLATMEWKQNLLASSSNVSVKLMDDSVQLEGVIVGALGIKRNALTSAMQIVASKEHTKLT